MASEYRQWYFRSTWKNQNEAKERGRRLRAVSRGPRIQIEAISQEMTTEEGWERAEEEETTPRATQKV